MKDTFVFGDHAVASVERAPLEGAPIPLDIFELGGHFIVECYDKDGNLKWEDVADNLVTTAGIAHILSTEFLSGTQVTTWYIGIVDNAGFTSFAAADTMASHTGWSEVTGGNFSNSARPAWTPGSVSAGAITNASTVNYNMTPSSTDTIKGLFITSDSTKGGTTGTLFSEAAFSGGTQATNNGDTLKITYTLAGTSS